MKEKVFSSTALNVLQGVLYTAQKEDYKHLVSDSLKEATTTVLSSSREGQTRLRQLNSVVFKVLVKIFERLMAPGITLHYVLRKKYIETFVRNAIEDKTTQVINLGAGFDTLAYRLSKEFSKVTFIEIDHPATQAKKMSIFSDRVVNNCHLLSVDFTTQKLAHALEISEYFDPDKKTLFISEGVLMYLDEKDVEDVFRTLKQITSTHSTFVFTFLIPKKVENSLLKLYLKFKTEHYKWYIDRSDIDSFAKSMGYEVEHIVDADLLKQIYIPNNKHRLFKDELIAVVH